jgi:hypothetical protein
VRALTATRALRAFASSLRRSDQPAFASRASPNAAATSGRAIDVRQISRAPSISISTR